MKLLYVLLLVLVPCLLQAQTATDYKIELDKHQRNFEQVTTLKEKRVHLKKIYLFLDNQAVVLIIDYMQKKFTAIHQQIIQDKSLAPLLPLSTLMMAQVYRPTSPAKGVELFFRALELSKKYHDREVFFGATHGIANDLFEQSKYKEALEKFLLLEEISTDPKLKDHIQSLSKAFFSNIYCVIAQIYLEKLEKPYLTRAEMYYQKAIQCAKKANDISWIGLCYGNMSKLYLLQNNLEKWRECLLLDVKYSMQSTNYGSAFGAYMQLVRTYREQRNYTESKIFLDSLENFVTNPQPPSKSQSIIDTAKVYQELYIYYCAIKQFEKAVKANDKYWEIWKRTRETTQKREIEEIITKYNVKIKEQEIATLQTQKATERWILYLVTLVALSVIALSVVLFRSNRRQIKTNALLKEQQEELNTQKDSLALQTEQLEVANKTKDQLFSIIAHDLRSPMMSFQGLNQQIKFFLAKNRPEKLERLGENIEKASTRLNSLLDNLLQWAMLQKQVIRTNPQNIDLQEATAHCLSHFEGLAQSQQVTLHQQVGKEFITTDYNILQTILRNLVSNALKFTPEGGEIVLAYQREPNTESGISNKEQGILSVRDTGAGMSAEQVANLFQGIQFKSEQGLRGEKGTGLGLQLCYELAQQIGATLQVESQEGQGTTFNLVFYSPHD